MSLLNRCIWNSTTAGTGSFTEGTAVAGYQTMDAAGAVAETYQYAAQSTDLSQWEYGSAVWNPITKVFGPRNVEGNSLGTLSPINFSSPPQVIVTALVENFIFQPAQANLSFYVDPTGSDSNPGTQALPFATPQHAANVANTFDYQNLWVPTININAGTYVDNGLSMVVTLPGLRNPGFGSFPSLNFTGPVTFSVAATNGAETVNVGGSWQFQGSTLTNDCFGTAISTAGDLSIECDLAFQDTGSNGFDGQFLTCINPQTTGQIACFRPVTWSILCPKLASFIIANQTTTPNFINNVTIHLPVGGIDMSVAGGFFLQTTALALMAFGNGCSFTGGPATGGAQYVVQNISQLAMSLSLLAQIPGDPKFNFIDGQSGLGDNNGRATNADCDPFYEYHQPASGFSITIGNNSNNVILDPSATLATGTITMPAHPSQQGQKISVRSSQTVTSLTVLASAGQNLGAGAPTTLLQGRSFSVIWNDQNSTWYFGN